MLFGNNTLSANIDITINGVNIDRVWVAKFLGVLIDEKLNWKDHIASVKSKLSKSTAILYKCSQLVDILTSCTAMCSYYILITVLKYGETLILPISVVLSYSKREQ